MNSQPIPDTDIENEAQRQKTVLLFLNAGIAFLVTLVNASLLAIVNASLHVSTSVALGWWCLMGAVATGRYLLARRFQRVKDDPAVAARWRYRYIAATVLAGSTWGVGAVLFMWHAPDGALMFTGLVLAGMVAGAVPILAPVRGAFVAFAAPVLLTVAGVIFLQAASELHWAYGTVTLVFMVAVSASARYLHDTLEVSIRLGLEQAGLAGNLKRARDAAEMALAEREQAERTLQTSEQRYRLILQNSPAGIFHYNDDLVITYCNQRLSDILQVSREQLLGLDMKRIKDQRVLPALRAVLEGRDGAYEGEYNTTLSGIQIWVAMSCAPMVLADGRIEGGIAIIEDITGRHRSEDEIRHLAYFDPLTQLPNRRLLMDRLGHAMTTGKRSREYGALMILDLDQFKSLNDTQGHDVGDRLLVEVARRLTASLRQEDTVSRLGGDEYVVLLEGLGTSEGAASARAETIAEKIRAALNEPYQLGGGESEYFSTTSIGMTLFVGQDVPPDVLMKQADVALYQAKGAGRNVVRFFSPAMQAAIEARAALEGALRRGLAKHEFRLYYQPQVDRDGRLVGAEALIRWLSPQQGLLSPALFIPLAEETGLIQPIGQWVLDTACAQLTTWERDPRTRDLSLSVNVSARQFRQQDFVEQVRASLLNSGANPARLKLEITEGVVLDDIESVIQRMLQIDSLGVRFSLDDFGTGYSSLSYLKRLPLEQIKVDKSFVNDIPGDANDAAIVSAILAMSRSLGLQVVAEGVETQAQRDFLLANGCDVYQGYLFGRPVPIEEWDGLQG